MYRIGVISDTHGKLREEVKEILRGCDAILHGGDIDCQKVVDELRGIAPLYAVRGNADREWAEDLPKTLTVNLQGITFYLVHNKKDAEEQSARADIVIYGHSHKYAENKVGPQLWLNPGSCGARRFSLPVTMAVIEVEDGKWQVYRKDIRAEQGAHFGAEYFSAENSTAGTRAYSGSAADKAQLIRNVMKAMDKGMPVEEIADKNHISMQLAEQICRMYATHPGIDVDGILNRISQ